MSAPAQELTCLYQQIVLDHSRQPRNSRRPALFDREAEGHNPLCGDKVRVYVQISDGMLHDVAFEASGCAICLASASLMTEATSARPLPDVRSTIDGFLGALMTGHPSLTGDLAALGGVSQYPSRIRCATLPWKTLQAALDETSGAGCKPQVSTEP